MSPPHWTRDNSFPPQVPTFSVRSYSCVFCFAVVFCTTPYLPCFLFRPHTWNCVCHNYEWTKAKDHISKEHMKAALFLCDHLLYSSGWRVEARTQELKPGFLVKTLNQRQWHTYLLGEQKMSLWLCWTDPLSQTFRQTNKVSLSDAVGQWCSASLRLSAFVGLFFCC